MEATSLYIYSLIALFLTVIDFWIAAKAYREPERIGKVLGLCATFSGEITLAYLVSVNIRSPLWMSVASSLCFAGIDWMLATLLFFVLLATGMYKSRFSHVYMWTMRWLALADTLVLLANIPTNLAVEVVALDPVGVAYQMKPLYIAHLAFSYSMAAVALAVLIYKCAHTPRQYRDQYLYLVAAILIVAAINAIFLFAANDSFLDRVDCSVLGYSLGLYLMYWTAFNYRTRDMLRTLSMTIFENIDQGIVLFDYADTLIMQNRRAEALLEGVTFSRQMPARAFLSDCGIAPLAGDSYSVQCDFGGKPLRCDFRRLKDERQRVIGNLFVFTDLSHKADITTGFEYAGDFAQFVAQRQGWFDHPATAVVFDQLGLREVNRVHGRDEGDRRIRSLAKRMRACMPENTVFLRGYEANLLAICPNAGEKDVLDAVKRVAEGGECAVMFGVCATSPRDGRDIVGALELAYRCVQTKKLLNPDSQRSQTLSSLVRALEETDPDTEAHVRRTRKMGAALAARVGLSDTQNTALALLCLLHDIGKITIPLEILNKPGKLTDQEWAVLRSHAEKGAQIARSSDELKGIADMVLCHHERWDGQGYPRGLAGEDIPILSRIIAVVDAYDAMVNDRAYRKALTPEAAQEEIRRNAGTQFDPRLAEAFLALLAEQPDIAVGEKVGGGEVRVFAQSAAQEAGTGATSPIAYSRYLLDVDERIIEVDDRFQEITGYAPDEAVGRMTQFDLVPAEDRTFYMLQVNNQFSRGNIAYLRHAIRRRDGSQVQVACFGKHYYDSAVKAFRSEILIFEL